MGYAKSDTLLRVREALPKFYTYSHRYASCLPIQITEIWRVSGDSDSYSNVGRIRIARAHFLETGAKKILKPTGIL